MSKSQKLQQNFIRKQAEKWKKKGGKDSEKKVIKNDRPAHAGKNLVQHHADSPNVKNSGSSGTKNGYISVTKGEGVVPHPGKEMA